jgi:hypothetical protein
VGGEVGLADVGLDLDDPADASITAGLIRLTDQPQPEQRRRDLEGRPAEQLPELVQLVGTLSGV